MNDVRILKGYSENEQKELKKVKEILRIDDLLHIITGFPQDTRCSLIRQKYDNAEKDERISIIRDILDFYTDKAKFAESKKYYVKLSKMGFPYLVKTNYGIDLFRNPGSGYKEEFTEQEIKDIDPRYMVFAVPVEENDE